MKCINVIQQMQANIHDHSFDTELNTFKIFIDKLLLIIIVIDQFYLTMIHVVTVFNRNETCR